MYQLPEPAIDDSTHYDEVVCAKREPRRRRLQNIRSDILTAYSTYRNRAPELGTLPKLQLTQNQTDALIHAFESTTNAMDNLRMELTTPLLGSRCGLCGLSEISELDHYLPKEQYPEFSILSRNLVPVCATCNRKKSNKILIDGTNIRRFLHLYFDVIPVERFLHARLVLDHERVIVRFELKRPRGVGMPMYRLLESHINDLDLINRYLKMALAHMAESRRSYRRWFEVDQTGQVLASELAKTSTDYAAVLGKNHWLSVLNRALSKNADFCNSGFTVLDL